MDKTRQRHPLETWHFLRSPHAPCHQTIEDPLKSGVEIHRSLLRAKRRKRPLLGGAMTPQLWRPHGRYRYVTYDGVTVRNSTDWICKTTRANLGS